MNKIEKRYAIVEHYKDYTPGFKDWWNNLIFCSDDITIVKNKFKEYKDYLVGYYEKYTYYICDFEKIIGKDFDQILWSEINNFVIEKNK